MRAAAPQPQPESVTSDDEGESMAAYGPSDDSDDDDDQVDAPAPATTAPTSPFANSPRPASPAPLATTGTTPLEQHAKHTPTTVGVVDHRPKEAYTGADHDPNKKLKAIVTRTVWGVAMAGGCIGLVLMGHVYVIALVFVCQATVFKELTALFDAGYAGSVGAAAAGDEVKAVRTPEREAKRKGRKEDRERWSRRMAWCVHLPLTLFLLQRRELTPARAQVLLRRHQLLPVWREPHLLLQAHLDAPGVVPPDRLLVRPAPPPHQLWPLRHRCVPTLSPFLRERCTDAVTRARARAGFVSFVATLNRNSLRRQFGLFGWIHMSLLLIVVSSHFIVDNILEVRPSPRRRSSPSLSRTDLARAQGMIWFWVPVSLVIMNDVAAYVCGMLFGRHQLIKLSPKKTVEGFVGAFFVTVLFAILVRPLPLSLSLTHTRSL